jgi:hypothetical protein
MPVSIRVFHRTPKMGFGHRNASVPHTAPGMALVANSIHTVSALNALTGQAPLPTTAVYAYSARIRPLP